jgi:hypothetical protein
MSVWTVHVFNLLICYLRVCMADCACSCFHFVCVCVWSVVCVCGGVLSY